MAGRLAALGTYSPSRGGSEVFYYLRDEQKRVILLANIYSMYIAYVGIHNNVNSD